MRLLQKGFFVISICFFAFFAKTVYAGVNITAPPTEIPIQLQALAIDDVVQINSSPKVDLVQEVQLALLPYIDWYLDIGSIYTIESMSSEIEKSKFTPYTPLNTPKEQGLSWFRIQIQASTSMDPINAFLDLGNTIQGIDRVWIKTAGAMPLSLSKTDDGLYDLKDLKDGGEIYFSIEGVPSLWFTPVLRSPEEKKAAPENKYQPLLLAALAILTLLCFLRSITDKGEWRFWAGLFGLAALGTQIFGIPATPRGQLIASDLLPVFSVAVALFLMPNVGRKLMNTQEKAKKADFLLLLLGVLGVLISISPLIPGFAWLARYTDIWQALAIFPFILTLFLIFSRVGRSAVYLIWLLIILAGVLIGLLGIGGTLETPLWAMAPLCSLVLAMGLLVICPARKNYEQTEDNTFRKNKQKNSMSTYQKNQNNLELKNNFEEFVGNPINITAREEYTQNSLSISSQKNTVKAAPEKISGQNTIKDEKKSVLSLTLPEESKKNKETTLPLKKIEVNPSTVINTASAIEYETSTFQNALSFVRIEQALRIPLDSLMRELCFLEQNILRITDVGKGEMLDRLNGIVGIGKDISALSHSLPKIVQGQAKMPHYKSTFNLQDLLQHVYDKVRNETNSSKIALSWYRSPYLGLWYIGEKDTLASLLYLMLSDAIRATEEGLVFLRVTRDEKSNDVGRLTFVVGDSGKGMPPDKRSSTLLSKIWELIAHHSGYLNVESGEEGTKISLTLSFTALEDDGHTPKVLPSTAEVQQPEVDLKRVLVIAQSTMQRHLFAFQLARMDCYITEAQTTLSGVAQYKNTPCSIVVFDGSLPENDIVKAIAQIRAFEGEHSLQPTHFLALTENKTQAELFTTAGCDYTLDQDVRRVTLRALIEKLLDNAKNQKNLPSTTLVSYKKEEASLNYHKEEKNHKEEKQSHKVSAVAESLPVKKEIKLVDTPSDANITVSENGILMLPTFQDKRKFLSQFFKKKTGNPENTDLVINDFESKISVNSKEEHIHLITEKQKENKNILQKEVEEVEVETLLTEEMVTYETFIHTEEIPEKSMEESTEASQIKPKEEVVTLEENSDIDSVTEEELIVKLEALHQALKNPQFDSIQKLLEDFYVYAVTEKYEDLAECLIEFQDAFLIGANMELQLQVLEREINKVFLQRQI